MWYSNGRTNSILEGIVHVDRSDLVGSAKYLATQIISALDDVAGTGNERTELVETFESRGTDIVPGTFCGSRLGWGLAEDVINFLTSCSVGQSDEDLSRAICEDIQSTTPLLTTDMLSNRSDSEPLPVVVEEGTNEESSEDEANKTNDSSNECGGTPTSLLVPPVIAS